MNSALKQRLVGAAVLLIFAGLLWPILFNFDESTRIEPLQLDIPDAPEKLPKAVSKTVASQQSSVNTNEKNQSSSNTKNILEKVAKEEKQSKAKKVVTRSAADPSLKNRPQLDANGVPVSFIVQVATFSEWANAHRFRNKLVNGGFKAYIKPETSVQPGPYIIAVGPLLTYEAATAMSDKLKQDHRINDSIIRRFRGS